MSVEKLKKKVIKNWHDSKNKMFDTQLLFFKKNAFALY